MVTGPETDTVGVVLTAIVTVPAEPGHPLIVAITEYVPAAAVVTLAIEGFCEDEVKLFGPVQLYVAPVTVLAVRFKVEPTQTGVLPPVVGVAGVGITVTTTEAGR